VACSIVGASIFQRAIGISIGKASELIPITCAVAVFAVGALLEVQAGCETLGWRALSMLVGLICMGFLSGLTEMFGTI
jgi:hypothetical protein